MLESTLRKVGKYRAALFVGGERRLKLRVHDLRGAFVTYALANGRTETWVMDRTGDRSSFTVNLDVMTTTLSNATTTEERIAIVRELGKVTSEPEARREARANVRHLPVRRERR
jgi:hypothetical protein